MKSKNWIVVCALFGLVALSQPALAGEFSVEAFGGYYDPDSLDEKGEIFGGRFGYRPSDSFGLALSIGVIDLEDDFLDIEDSDLRFQLLLADLSFQWHPGGGGFYVMAGPGFSTIDVEIDLAGDNNDFNDDDSTFTLHGGVGYRWDIGSSFFIRPEAKARWFDGTDFDADERASWDGLDTEYTLALGFRFGSN
ncbi:MAG TPA: outer membrane beta-barrel protein [Thermoanaerobaculia bacterium]|nr:outer membrane beta-barrel protein [Thermoanaerobaculia bacterium]